MNDEFKVTSNHHVSCRADNALAARWACVLKRPIFYLAAYIDNNVKWKHVGRFWWLKYSSRGVHLRNTPRISLTAPTLDNQSWSEYRKSLTLLVDWCLVNKTVQPFCLCYGIWYPINSIEEPSVVSRLTGSWHFLKGKPTLITFLF